VKYVALLTNTAEDVERWEHMSPEEAQAARAQEMPKWTALFEQLASGGHYLDGAELESPTEAKTVRVRDGETLVTDGPYAETKEQVGGFFLLECQDLDEAIAIAAKIPVVSRASVELRPIIEH
jgi:hypothetical protein